MSDHYILNGREVVPADLITWATWLESVGEGRVVARDLVGDIVISTVFIGLDHRFGDGPPLIFETMVLGGVLDQEMERYSTYDEAEAGHQSMVERVRKSLN
jgi:hypothetical protein